VYGSLTAITTTGLQTIRCFGRLVLYIVPCVMVLLPVRLFTKVPSFVFRKMLHIVAFTCFTVMMLSAASWQAAALTSLIIAAIAYPLLARFENRSWYAGLFVQKSPGEIKRSLLMLFLMFAAVIALSWGILGKPDAATASILMWGVGDASAALVGIPFGKHKIKGWRLDGKKSLEGSISMLIVSALTGFALLHLYCGYGAAHSAVCALIMSALGTAAELYSPSEWDTVTVPLAMLAAAIAFL